MTEQPREIKGYQLQDMLGEGGFGTVYRAYQPLIRRDVAVKVIRSSLANQPEFIKRFEAEAQLVARLEHLHIVPLYDFWRDPSGAYLVMRLLRGGSLRDELQQRGAFAIDDVERIITQIASALSVAHRKGVVHRDLKPANILLDEEKNGYLTDFGIAKDVEQATDDEEDGAVVGTPAYSPPEQLQSQVPTPQSDIYSFGLIVYELITGKDAMAGDSISDAIRNQLYEPLPEIDPEEYGIPPEINDILATATAKKPEDRYTEVVHFARDFKHALAGFKSNPKRAFNEETGEMVVVPADTMSFSIEIGDIGSITSGQGPVVNPYKGLRAFQESDSSDFYGRSALTQKLVGRLNEDRSDARFLAVIGPSGSGKSSVVKAGVIPAVRDGALVGSENFYVAEMVPGADALEELESVLLSVASKSPDNIRDILQSSETGLFDLINQILPDDDSELFLLIDQFEEVFTQTEDNNVRTHFMNSLQYAVTHPQSRLWAVITIRADFYDKPLLYPKFGELVRERGEIVLPLSRAELEAAIVEPARSTGVEMEQELIANIIQDVQEEPGALPLLQYALTELFDRRSGMLMTLDTYLESGGVLGSLARRAEELYLEMTEPRQEAIRQMFLRLVTLGEGTEDTRRRVRWSELSFYRGDDNPMDYVLDVFTRYRLLTGDNDPQTREPTVEVAHEALIRQWQRLRDWLADNRDNIRLQRQVVAAVNEWHQNGHDPSFLASGMRLEQFELLLDNKDIALTLEEKEYIHASVAKRQEIIEEQLAQQRREQELEEQAQRRLEYMVAAMAVGLIIAIGFALFAFNQRQVAVVAQAAAEREALENNSISLSNLARFWGRDGEEALLGLSYAVQANSIENPPAEVQQTLAELAWQPGALRQLVGHVNPVWDAVFSVDGQTVYSGDGSLDISDGNILEWDVRTGEIVREFPKVHTDRIYSMAVSPDGNYLATGSQDTNIVIWDVATGEEVHVLTEHGTPVWDLIFTHDSTRLIAGDNDGNIIVWDVASGTIVNQFPDLHTNLILDMDITSDDRLVITGSFDRTIVIWNLETGIPVLELADTDDEIVGEITGARFLPDETRFVTTNQQRDLIIWDTETGQRLMEFSHNDSALRGGFVIAPDGQRVIAADDNGNIMVWDITQNDSQPIYYFRAHDWRVSSLTMNASGNMIVSPSLDGTLIVWDLEGRGAEIKRFGSSEVAVNAADLSADGELTIVADALGRIQIWNTITNESIHTIMLTDSVIHEVAFNADASLFATAHDDGTVRVWDTVSGQETMVLSGSQAPVRTVSFSPDGRYIAGAGGQIQVSGTRPINNHVFVWDMDGELIHELNRHTAAVRSLVFTPDSSYLLSASDDTLIFLWDVENGNTVRTYSGHSDSVTSIAVNLDGTEMLSASLDGTLVRWNIESGAILGEPVVGNSSGIRAVAFHPDGIHAISAGGSVNADGASDEYEIRYWDITTGEVQRALPGHTDVVRSLAINADGTQILSASDDGNVILWYADTLDTFLERIRETYQILCVEDDDAENCEAAQDVVLDDEGEEEASVSLSFPSQSDELAPYADGSECLLIDEGVSPPNTAIDLTPFANDGPYIIGYSNGSVDGTSADWIAAWATYQAEQVGVDIMVRDAMGNPALELENINSLVDSGIDALIINPVEQGRSASAELNNLLSSIIETGIPVIAVGNRPEESAYTTYVGHDPYEIGCIMAQEIVALIDGEGQLGVINGVNLSIADVSYKEGLRGIIGQYLGVLSVAESATGYDIEAAQSVTNTVAVDGILGYVGSITIGAEEGVRGQGLNYVPFVSDHDIELAQFAVENDVEGVFVRSSAMMGATALDTALAILEGEGVTSFVRVVPELITTDDLMNYDLDNAPSDSYLGDWETLPDTYYPSAEETQTATSD